MTLEQHTLKPVIFPDSKILILGSFPSIKSLEEGFYYAHPRNQFWPILSQIFNEKATTKEKKTALCKKHHLALFDSAKSLQREKGNSSDTNLKNIEVNDFKTLLQKYPNIELILFTGKKAEQIFNKKYKYLPIKRVTLPSTSPAHASMKFEEKLQRYKTAFEEILSL
ncbi:DNA-deoxyinosine glycosylase [Sulfurimonas paralvinellae]|uniref:DNA-deoxyinosine glycosylase n=1 Tax=Sulfurimonas paralvinellae TaxID=317658 RepID=A0A7M1B803_9BACT|nr:DNA-deoxyinosine glycosylase [Sulfurimonas paralvinellae]QOP45576.1 DNA-deoxyinosine glycosylase [Sulfurimonas paralvinellae]